MIRLSATKVELAITESETITSGAQRVFTCVFALSEDWDGLDRTAVFRAGARSVRQVRKARRANKAQRVQLARKVLKVTPALP